MLFRSAFSRKTHEIGETELLIMVTPEMAGAMRPDQVPHDAPGWMQDEPTSKELFLDGMLEVPSYGPECADCQDGGVSGGVAYGNGMPGMISSGAANCAPPENFAPETTLRLDSTEQDMTIPELPPATEIQTMSGRADKQKVIQAGGDPFRVPSRREIPESTSRKPKFERSGEDSKSPPASGPVESRSLPGPIGPQRSNSARPISRTRSTAPDPKSVRDLSN